VQVFRGQDEAWRALLALVVLLGVAAAFAPARLSAALAVGAAGGLVAVLVGFEGMLDRLFDHPATGLEVRWEVGAYSALGGFPLAAIAARPLRRTAPRRSG
jgi:hypothetical protein